MQSQLIFHYLFVDTCSESQGSDLGENMGRGTGDIWRVDKCSRLHVRLMAGLSSVTYWIGLVDHAWLNTAEKYSRPVSTELSQKPC